MCQRCVRDVSAKWHSSMPYNSYQSILSHTISNAVLSGMIEVSYSIYIIVPEESSHIYCFNPKKFYPLIVYNMIINQNMSIPQCSKNYPFGP